MTTATTFGFVILGLAIIGIGFTPSFIALYKKNRNRSQIFKTNPIVILGLGAIGLGLSLLFQKLAVNTEVWALVILLSIEAIRLAAWVFLVIMAIKDKDLPLF